MRNYIIKIIGVFTVFIMVSCSEDTIDLEGLGSITGRVVNEGTNEPIENVKIETNPGTSTVFTDKNGDYKIKGVPAGKYSLSAQKEGLLAAFEGITVITDNELEIVFEMKVETANNRPPSAATLSKPLDNELDQPVSVKLVWSASDPDKDDLTYVINLRNDKNTSVEVFENITDTTYTVTDLSYATRYFWQVTASDGINPPVNSATFTFETIDVPNNRVVFTRIVNGNSVIYSANESGGTEIELTSSSKNSFRPRRNVATGKIAFLQSVGSQTHLFIMDEDGTNVKQVTSSIGVSGFSLEEIDFSWSQYGAKLLFPNQNKLYSINTDGSGLTLVYQTTGDLITEVDKNDTAGLIAIKTNDLDGYSVQIFTINDAGVVQDIVLTGENGAAGSIHLSAAGDKLLYGRDISGSEDPTTYRQLDTHVFVYEFAGGTSTDISTDKPAGTNDLDARFAPNEASAILVNTSNDGVSVRNIQTVTISNTDTRNTIIENGEMPDWK
ncbi:carboxypeptidase regulatory-like domain-containing protein [Aquimarina sp. 2201CG1-2-11]|uniref:carboxypeptidase regulatory-like domain-containing protein n=1 Tax=Aquimarina discodermiae TaxID=3231043 RepID=UPI003463125F